jgi:hypothetical protein
MNEIGKKRQQEKAEKIEKTKWMKEKKIKIKKRIELWVINNTHKKCI